MRPHADFGLGPSGSAIPTEGVEHPGEGGEEEGEGDEGEGSSQPKSPTSPRFNPPPIRSAALRTMFPHVSQIQL